MYCIDNRLLIDELKLVRYRQIIDEFVNGIGIKSPVIEGEDIPSTSIAFTICVIQKWRCKNFVFVSFVGNKVSVVKIDLVKKVIKRVQVQVTGLESLTEFDKAGEYVSIKSDYLVEFLVELNFRDEFATVIDMVIIVSLSEWETFV